MASSEKTTIDERRKIGARGVDAFIKRARRYCPELTFTKTKDRFAPVDVEVRRKGVIVAYVEVKHRQDWTGVCFPYSSIRVDYQKVAAAQKNPIPTCFCVLSVDGLDVRFLWNLASVHTRFKPNRGGGAQWGVSYDISTEEFFREWSDLWRFLTQLYAA